jgi:H+/Cl- antiporter ClcA
MPDDQHADQRLDPGTRRARAVVRRSRPVILVPLLLAGLVAALAGPVLCVTLVVRGLREGRPDWIVLGALCGLPLVLIAVGLVRRALRRRPRSG